MMSPALSLLVIVVRWHGLGSQLVSWGMLNLACLSSQFDRHDIGHRLPSEACSNLKFLLALT
jgi:hypothetical protein